MDVIQSGKGISIDKSLNKVVINSDNTYTTELLQIDINKPSYVKPKDGNNLIVLNYNYNVPCGDLYINIDDEYIKWKVGKSFKMCLIDSKGNYIDFKDGSFIEITIKADGLSNKLSINKEEIDGKKMIELVCIDIDNLGNKQFIYFIK